LSEIRPTRRPAGAKIRVVGQTKSDRSGPTVWEVVMNRMERYASDDLLMFRGAIEHAVKCLPDSRRTPECTFRMAKEVPDRAATAERDPIGLKVAALSDPCMGARRCQA
jgi:hypothetical protein